MPRPPANKDTKDWGITRLDGPSATGWWVRLYKAARDPKASKVFSDSVCGGRGEALALARAWRDEQARALGIKPVSYGKNGFHRRHRESSHVGVTLIGDRAQNPQRVNWVAKISVNGRQTRKSFSVRKYGYAHAWKMACAVRQAHTGERIPDVVPAPSAWLEGWAGLCGISLK